MPFSISSWHSSRASFQARCEPRREGPYLCDAFFKLPAARNSNEGQKLIRETLAGSDIMRFRFRKIAIDLLRKYLQRFLVAEDRLVAAGGQWFQDSGRQAEASVAVSDSLLTVWAADFQVDGSARSDVVACGSEGRAVAGPVFGACKNRTSIFTSTRSRWSRRGGSFRLMRHALRASTGSKSGRRFGATGCRYRKRNGWRLWETTAFGKATQVFEVLDAASQEILTSVAEILKTRTRSKAKREIVEVQRLQILDWIALRKHGVTVKLSAGGRSRHREAVAF